MRRFAGIALLEDAAPDEIGRSCAFVICSSNTG